MRLSIAKNIIQASVEANLKLSGNTSEYTTPMLWGVAGLGKTTLVHDIAGELDMECRVVILAQYDAGELGGFPYLQDDTFVRARPHWFPTEGRGILFLDELPQSPVANQNIAAQLVNERRIGEHHLGSGWSIVCAGNDLSHRAGTNAMPTHLKDRLLHLEVEPNLDDALSYMNAKGVRPEVTGFLRFSPKHLSDFDKDAKACPSPRSWEKVSNILGWGLDSLAESEAIAGQVGVGSSAMFKAFQQVYRELPDPELPLRDPDNAPIPDSPTVLHAVCSGLAYRVNKSNAGNFMKYLKRFTEREYEAFAIKDALSRFPDLKKDPAFRDWVLNRGAELIL